MAQVKAHEVDRYLAKPDAKHRVLLIYGPDAGLVSERATVFAKNSGTDIDDPFSTIMIDAEQAATDTSTIADEAYTVSMFGGNRLVWIKGSTRKNLAGAIQPILDLPPEDALVIVEAGDLKKSAPLRTRIEKSPRAIALPCYQDQTKAIESVIDEELKLNNLSMDKDAKSVLLSLLGADRLASRGEVQKLCLYCSQNGTVTVDDIYAIVGDASALAIDTVLDAASTGDVETMEHTFKRLIAQGTAVYQIINAAQRHFQSLHLARSSMESGNQSASSAVGAMRPPVNFKRKDKLARALSTWPLSALERLLIRLDKTSLETRTNANLSIPLASTTLLAITLEARARLNRRG